MAEFAIGIGVIFAWLGIWVVVLRACGIAFWFRGTPEQKAQNRERILRLGKTRYVLIFGVLGWGLAVGFGGGIAHTVSHGFDGADFAIRIAIWTLGGWLYGVRMWNESFRGEVPFPPPFLSQK